MRNFLLSFFSLCVLTACVANPQHTTKKSRDLGPQIWRVADEDTEIFFLGTVHLLPEETKWQTPEFLNILDTSDILYFETNSGDVTPQAHAEFFQSSLRPEPKSLADQLSPDEATLLSETISSIGLTAPQLDAYQPWYVSLLISRLSLEKLGFTPNFGVESIIYGLIEDRDIERRSLENIMTVPRAMNRVPEAEQIKLVAQTLTELDNLKADFDMTLEAWITRDLKTLEQASSVSLKEELPSVYAAILVDRNEIWAEELTRALNEDTGRILVAVGAAHLLGPDSVLEMLEEEGFSVTLH